MTTKVTMTDKLTSKCIDLNLLIMIIIKGQIKAEREKLDRNRITIDK